MQRTLYTPNSITGGATLIRPNMKPPNTVFIQNNDAANDAYFGHSRLELQQPRPDGNGFPGFKVAKATQQQLFNWEGDLWGIGSADGTNVDVEVSTK